jgi:hypothetical protein
LIPKYPKLPSISQLILTGTSALVIGTFIEVVQNHIGRNANWLDIYRGFLGAVFCNLLFIFKKNQNKLSIASLCLIISLIVYDQKNLFIAIKLEAEMYVNYPSLATFNSHNSVLNWTGNKLVIINLPGTSLNVLNATLEGNKSYTTITLKHFPQNWAKYNTLEIGLFLLGEETIKICIKITDLEHNNNNQSFENRFNICQDIAPKLNHLKIPLFLIERGPIDRKLNLQEISEVTIFARNLENKKDINIHYVQLN